MTVGPRVSRRAWAAVPVLLLAAALVALIVGGGGRARTHPAAAAAPVATTAPPTTLAPKPTGITLVATTKGAIPASAAPGAPAVGTVPSNWYGYPSILPVVNRAPGWLEVRLAQRPNQSTAWVPAADVTLSSTPYRIVLDLTTEHLIVYQDDVAVLSFPAGIGTTDDPTVTGQYFMTMRAPAPDAGYGPFVLVTSAHSDSITDWEGSGDAIIAIHGPITTSDDEAIGGTGARISHGCIRLHDDDLARLAMITPGTPIDIVA